MARDYRLVVRLTNRERQKVENLARTLGVSMSEVVQDWIKTLPEPEIDRQPLLKKEEE
ncbi:DNA-binding protein [Scytonema sp. UIC 10036]|uniref:DNA-binding protein n=1 Tax=Scytonema sp. UIC 10036 TaxID=2304196 RepID=UPI0012DAA82F|nr:DNA-binding protein [Scytonema sp. UIC 10036]MUG94871.1 DNA-binding protein [Scytonema sp. UIC 10036]MUG99451.1 DNA-binding protein [Scytonema sp. UIC 10036]